MITRVCSELVNDQGNHTSFFNGKANKVLVGTTIHQLLLPSKYVHNLYGDIYFLMDIFGPSNKTAVSPMINRKYFVLKIYFIFKVPLGFIRLEK